MTVYETEIPGVGRKFEVDLDDGARAIVLIHHDGRREVFRRADPEADSEELFDLSSKQARTIGAIMEGAYVETVATEDLSVPLGDAIIEWVDLPAESPLAGRTLADTNLRAETGASVIAVQRGPDTIPNPEPGFDLAAGDILVALGSRSEQATLRRLVAGEGGEDGEDTEDGEDAENGKGGEDGAQDHTADAADDDGADG
jgi:TrkA domain protein